MRPMYASLETFKNQHFISYAWEGVLKKHTLCTFVIMIMSTIVNGLECAL